MKQTPKSAAALLAAAIVLAIAGSALAVDTPKAKTEGPPPALGEVWSVSSDLLKIKDHRGLALEFVLNSDTKYGTAKEPQKFEGLARGDQVFVSYRLDEEANANVANVVRELRAKMPVASLPPVAGSIVWISYDAVSLKEHDGKEYTYALDGDTRFGSKAEPQSFSDFEKGDHVFLVYAKGEGKQTWVKSIMEMPHTALDKSPPPSAGEILSVDTGIIRIREHDGKEHEYLLTGDTRFGTKAEPQKLTDMEKGDYVIIRYMKDECGNLVATAIMELPGHGHTDT